MAGESTSESSLASCALEFSSNLNDTAKIISFISLISLIMSSVEAAFVVNLNVDSLTSIILISLSQSKSAIPPIDNTQAVHGESGLTLHNRRSAGNRH